MLPLRQARQPVVNPQNPGNGGERIRPAQSHSAHTHAVADVPATSPARSTHTHSSQTVIVFCYISVFGHVLGAQSSEPRAALCAVQRGWEVGVGGGGGGMLGTKLSRAVHSVFAAEPPHWPQLASLI